MNGGRMLNGGAPPGGVSGGGVPGGGVPGGGAPDSGVFAAVVGQDEVVAELRRAAAAAATVLRGEHVTGMTHAWLFTGPPGSGRSVEARAFAAPATV